ncbi:MAG: hypothetical protein Ct9H300mP8_10360 [Gammaproteobacteria bacterium]|nr:MAG: hypothetical protein Ct9H300mP8_10360 [Gammaproteobacteria bacterium]
MCVAETSRYSSSITTEVGKSCSGLMLRTVRRFPLRCRIRTLLWPPYIGPSGWNRLDIEEAVNWDEVEAFVFGERDEHLAPKRMLRYSPSYPVTFFGGWPTFPQGEKQLSRQEHTERSVHALLNKRQRRNTLG